MTGCCFAENRRRTALFSIMANRVSQSQSRCQRSILALKSLTHICEQTHGRTTYDVVKAVQRATAEDHLLDHVWKADRRIEEQDAELAYLRARLALGCYDFSASPPPPSAGCAAPPASPVLSDGPPPSPSPAPTPSADQPQTPPSAVNQVQIHVVYAD